jgi:hypothetical protein
MKILPAKDAAGAPGKSAALVTYAITWADWEETRGHIHETSCSVVISARRE